MHTWHTYLHRIWFSVLYVYTSLKCTHGSTHMYIYSTCISTQMFTGSDTQFYLCTYLTNGWVIAHICTYIAHMCTRHLLDDELHLYICRTYRLVIWMMTIDDDEFYWWVIAHIRMMTRMMTNDNTNDDEWWRMMTIRSI